MKKPTLGVKIFAAFFILMGIQCLRGVVVYPAYRSTAPYIYKAVMSRFVQVRDLVDKNTQLPEHVRSGALMQLQEIEILMKGFKKNYIDGMLIPSLGIVFVVASLAVAALFIYTGYGILHLKAFTRRFISLSFVAGLLLSLLFFIKVACDMMFILGLSDRFASIIAAVSQTPSPGYSAHRIIWHLLTSGSTNAVIALFYALYLMALCVTSIFFSREKIKELFKTASQKCLKNNA